MHVAFEAAAGLSSVASRDSLNGAVSLLTVNVDGYFTPVFLSGQ
jgi:hypothetical protein